MSKTKKINPEKEKNEPTCSLQEGRKTTETNPMERANLSLNRLLFFGYGWRYLSKRFDECALFRITLNAHTFTRTQWHSDNPWNSSRPRRPRSRLSPLPGVAVECTPPSSKAWSTRARTSGKRATRRRLLKKFSFGLSFVFPISFISLFLRAKERDKRKMKTKRARATLPPIVREPTRAG